MGNRSFILMALLVSSFLALFYLFNFLSTCHKYSLPYLIYIHNHQYPLDDVMYYALTPDIFDPWTEWNLPQSELRDLCVTTSQKEFNTSHQIHQHLYSTRLFNHKHWSSPYLRRLCEHCFLTHWINTSSELLNLLEDEFADFNAKYTRFLRYILTNCRSHTSSPSDTAGTNAILVVGASASGLITALSIVRSPLQLDNLIIIDKRSSYSRPQWFDLVGKPFYNTLDVLFDEFAFDTQTVRYVKEVNEDLTTIVLPSYILESFLAKTLDMTGVDIQYNHQYLGYCKGFEHVAVILHNTTLHRDVNATIWNCGSDSSNLIINTKDISEFHDKYGIDKINRNMFQLQAFDMLVGCDGTHSSVRKIYKMGWYRQNIVQIGRFITSKDRYKQMSVLVDNLQQISLLVNFKTVKHSHFECFDENNPYESHNCPKLRLGTDDRVLDPWSASFHVDGVHTVFKRFYDNECQMQILLDHKTGGLISHKQEENSDLLWGIVLNTSTHYLEHAPSSVAELKTKYLVQSVAENEQIMTLTHSIFLAERSMKLINDTIPILLVGDASMKAHYRLGVGINRIIDAYHEYVQFYEHMSKYMRGENELIDFIVYFTTSIESKLQYFVQFQTSTILLESYCDFIIFFNKANDLITAQTIAIKDYQVHDYIQISSMRTRKKLMRDCIAKYKSVHLYSNDSNFFLG
eukprot:861961_1